LPAAADGAACTATWQSPRLWREAFDAAKGRGASAKLLAANASPMQPAFTLLEGL
jgi:hypothetical protein